MKLNGFSSSQRIILFIGCTLFLSSVITLWVRAQTGQAFVTSWKANSFVPVEYSGKALPTEKTAIDASFEILQNGKFIDLSNYTITWAAEGRVIGEGKNKKSVSFTPHAFRGQSVGVRLVAKGPNGTVFTHDFPILISPPELTIASPYPSPITENPGELRLRAFPYFFNISHISDLILNWQVSGSPAADTGEKDLLTISLPRDLSSARGLRVEAQAKNSENAIEQASRAVIYNFF